MSYGKSEVESFSKDLEKGLFGKVLMLVSFYWAKIDSRLTSGD